MFRPSKPREHRASSEKMRQFWAKRFEEHAARKQEPTAVPSANEKLRRRFEEAAKRTDHHKE